MVEVTTENIIQKIKARAPALLEKLGSIQILDFKSFQTFSEKYIDDSAEIKSRILNSSLQTLDTETLTNILLNPSAISLFDLIYFENLVSNVALKKLEGDNQELKKALTTKEVELESMKKKHKEVKEHWESLAGNFNSATDARKRHEKKNDKLTEENDKLTEERTKLIQELKVANEQLLQSKIKISALETKLKDMTDEKEKINPEQHNKNSQEEDSEEERKNGKRTKPQQSAVYARTSEELELMRMDLIEMPQCAERSLNELIYWVSSVSPSKDEIVKELKEFEAHLIKEELNSATVTKSLEQIKSCITNQYWSQAAIYLSSIMKEIRPLNIPELIRLIEKAGNAGTLLQGKKAILLLGETGAGKSTTIHFLCGSKLKEGQDERGLDHIYPEKIYNEDLRMITVSAKAKSETRYITAIPLDDSYVICDTPGFEDTSGAEVDIANGIGVIKAIMKCEEVKPVLLISSKGIGDRLQGLKKLASTMIKIMPKFSENMEEIVYFFSKFSDKEAKILENKFKEVKNSMNPQEIADKAFGFFFDDVLLKLQDPERKSAKVIDPIKNDPAKVLQDLKSSKFITKPEEVFKTFLTDKSLGVLKQQLNKYKSSINRAYETHNYKYIAYKLGKLKKTLDTGIGEKEIKETYDFCVHRIEVQMEEQYNTVTQAFNRRFSSQLEIAKEDISEYKRALQSSIDSEDLRKAPLSVQIVQRGSYIQNLTFQIGELTKIFSKQVQSLELEDLMILKSILTKMKILRTEIQEPFINSEFEEMLRLLRQKMKNSEDALKESISVEAFDVVATKLTEFSKLNDLLPSDEKKVDCDSYKNLVMDHLTNKTDNINCLLDSEVSLREEHITKIYSWCEKLHSIQELFNQSHHPIQEVKENYDSFTTKMRRYADKLASKISQEVRKTDSRIDFEKIKSLFKILNELKNIPKLENRMYPPYSVALDGLSRELREFKRIALSSISHLYQNASAKVDHKKLSECLTYLEQAKWIDDFQPGICEEVTKYIQIQIVTYVRNIKTSTEKLKINVKNHEKLKNASELMSNLISLRPLETNLPDLKKEIDAMVSWFQSVMSAAFDRIKENFSRVEFDNLKSFDPQQAEDALNFVELCDEILPNGESQAKKASDTKDILEKYLRKYFNTLRTQVMTEFNAILEALKERKEESKQPEPTRILVIVQKLRQNVDSIGELLMIIRDLKANYPSLTIYSPKKDMIEEFSKTLGRTKEDINTEIEGCNGEIERIHSRLPLLKVLSNLDEYVQGEKFSDLFKQYQDLYYKSIMGVEKEAMEKFKNLEFQEGVDLMSQLDTKNTSEKFQRLKRDLESFLNELVYEYRTKAATLKKDLPADDIRIICNDLNKIDLAKQKIPPGYRNRVENSDILQICTQEIKDILVNRLSKLVSHLQGTLRAGYFSGAEDKIEHITRLKHILSPHLQGEEILNQIDSLIKWYFEDGLQELDKKYQELDLLQYAFDPPKNIFSTQNDHPQIEYFNKIKKTIQNKCLDELKKAKNLQPPSVDNLHIAKVEAALQYLPVTLQEVIIKAVVDCKKDIALEIIKIKDELDKIEKFDNLGELKDALESFQKSGNSDAVEMIILKIQICLGELISKLKENFQQNKTKKAFDIIQKLREYKSLFLNNGMFKERTSKIYLEVEKVVGKKFEELCTGLSEALTKGGDKESNEFILATATYVECIFDFKDFKDSLVKPTSCEDAFLPKSFDTSFDAIYSQLKSFVWNYESTFHKFLDALENGDSKNLHSVLKFAEKYQKWTCVIQKFNKRTEREEMRIVSPLQKLTDKIKKAKQAIVGVEFGTSESYKLEAELINICSKLNFSLLLLKEIKNITIDLGIDVKPFFDECSKSLSAKLTQINDEASKNLKSFLLQPTISIQEGQAFSNSLRILSTFQDNVTAISVPGSILTELDKPIFDRITEIEKIIFDSENKVDAIADSLIAIKCIAQGIVSKKKKIHSRLEEILHKIKTRNKQEGAELISKLGVILNRDRIGKMIIAELQIFEGYALSLFNQKVQAQDIIYVLKNIQGDNIDTEKLKDRYDKYIKEYDALVLEYLKTDINFNALIEKLKVVVCEAIKSTTINELSAGKLKRNTLLTIPSILAHVFAIWTLMNSQHYFEASRNGKGQKTYLFTPHPAQVISLFRIFCIGDKDDSELKNNLVEIKTGEGKSVTLAVASVVFALLGFEVSCACYSEYLSKRDEKAFESLFEKLDLKRFIQYGTFDKLCESVINEDIDIRSTVENLILPENEPVSNSKSDRPKILLIDEVDVFFKSDFYGETYNPITSLKDVTIKELAELIWNKKSTSNLSFDQHIKSEQAFLKCCQKFKGWEEVIEEATKDMISHVKTFGSHKYEIKKDKIGYKSQDTVTTNLRYGYWTMFAYFKEHESGKISSESLETNVYINLQCGRYSYAEIPNEFKFIAGVTGTLKTLTDFEKKILKNKYHINKSTFVPSVYGEDLTKYRFSEDDDIMIVDKDYYHNAIIREINTRLAGKNTAEKKRAVLVFFDSEEDLMEFKSSRGFSGSGLQNVTNYLTEGANDDEKEQYIREATDSGRVTLFTKSFGRGTDFKVYDNNVENNGGVHVIQTFLSEEASEYHQIRGRTARQGALGSYSMILLDTSLKSLGVTSIEIDALTSRAGDTWAKIRTGGATIHSFLDARRNELYKKKNDKSSQIVENAKLTHKNSYDFLKKLRNSEIAEVKKYLITK